MKKVFLSVLSILGVASCFALTSCGGGDEGESANQKVIKIWAHKSEAEAEGMVYAAIADSFNDAGFKTADGTKDLKVKIEYKNSSDTLATAIQAEILAGGLPDIVAVDAPNISAYADAEILTDISPYISEETKNSYVNSVIEQGTYKGGLYALSAMDAPTGMYYNKDLLKQVGYEESDFGTPTNPWSFKDTMEAMKKLKDASLPYQIKLNLGFGGDEGVMYLYSSLVYSAGGTFAGANGKADGYLNSEESIAGIKQLEPFFSVEEDGKSWIYNGSNTDALATKECAFEIYGPWNIASFAKNYSEFVQEYGIMPMPVYESESGVKGKAVAGCGSWGFGVTPYSKDIASAATVLQYFTGEEATKLLYQSIGTFPTNKNVLATSEEFQTGQLKEMADILNTCATPRPQLVNYPILSSNYSSIIEYIETAYGEENYNLKSYVDKAVQQIDR
ncbi:MAG: extracellular solute-binding protein [Acholeplasmatales bacterium]|nr:extracellular solute-binding protein [Acholeplasmatales bacterium]